MEQNEPSLELLWGTFTGYQRSAVLKAAIELDVFTHIAAGATTIDALAARCGAAARGLRALLNHLVADGFLTRDGEQYRLGTTSAAFLDRNSRRIVQVPVEYRCFEIPDHFVIGFGLDYNQLYRNLNYVAVLKPERE